MNLSGSGTGAALVHDHSDAANSGNIPQSSVTNLVSNLAAKEPSLGNPDTDGKVLSSTAAGVRSWAAASSGAMTLIERKSGAAASYSFTSIPGGYKSLLLVGQARGDHADVLRSVRITFNGDTGSNYDSQVSQLQGTGTTGTAEYNAEASGYLAPLVCAGGSAGYAVSFEARIPNYAGTDFEKDAVSASVAAHSTTSIYLFRNGVHWRSAAAVTQIDLAPDAGSFAAGSVVDLYGLS